MAGLLQIQTNAEMEANRASAAVARDAQSVSVAPLVSELAGYIRRCFQEASEWRRRTVDSRFADCLRRRKGHYSPEKLALIRARGGSDQYFNLTKTKCVAAESWIDDVLSPSRGPSWAFEPTPIPDLPEELEPRVAERVFLEVGSLRASGRDLSAEETQRLAFDVYDEALRAYRQDARDRARQMAQKVSDQLAEGGWDRARREFLSCLCTYPLAVLKGPVVRPQRRLRWVGGGIEVETEDIPTWECVPVQNFFPAPNARRIEDGFVCELVTFSLSELSEWRSAPGWNRLAIEKTIADGGGRRVSDWSSPELDSLQGVDTSRNGGLPPDTVEGIEFWGRVQGGMLRDWGMDGIEDTSAFYSITAICLGEVVHAILNPDPLGRSPYYATSYDKAPGEIFGDSIPESMSDCQDPYNACMRNTLNNLAYASGFQVAYDVDLLDGACDPTQVYPGKVWPYHGMKSASMRKPVEFFQPANNSDELIRVGEYFARQADDRTMIPRYAHGNENVGGAGETASGLNMLMNAAAKGVRRIVSNFDADVMSPMLESIYRWNLLYLEDSRLKGDCRVSPRGAVAAIVREETQRRRQEFLERTANDIDMQIIGMEGRRRVLAAVASDLDLPDSEIVPDEETLRERVRSSLMEQAAEVARAEDESAAAALNGTLNDER